MKNGAPIQMLTRMTQNRAQTWSPIQGTGPMPILSRSQLKAECEGSNSHSHASVDMAAGMTQGMSSMPRHFRCLLAGTLWTRCAMMKPRKALKATAVRAKMQLCRTTIQNVSRVNRNVKFLKPTNSVMRLFNVARCKA